MLSGQQGCSVSKDTLLSRLFTGVYSPGPTWWEERADVSLLSLHTRACCGTLMPGLACAFIITHTQNHIQTSVFNNFLKLVVPLAMEPSRCLHQHALFLSLWNLPLSFASFWLHSPELLDGFLQRHWLLSCHLGHAGPPAPGIPVPK